MGKMNMLLILAAFLASGCTDADEATKALVDSGYKDVQIKGYSFTGCSKDDAFHTEFLAKGATGNEVRGVVCSGWLKGSTIRLF
ncbi:hypothetical protein AB3H13_26790 [Escherichia coli]|uniref:hypothetical protein n=1 Tax=Escherichia coli TaxID=562 RepID=UPI0034665DB4|nr:hypothetical protein [Escherichia coli]HCI3360069.1 hypothetical protein [Escherichia coli]HCI3411011.1 hypothetical protein [Escherichia coli]HCI3685527.1 hypothetical protein [Escherichia coli]HCI4966551.1 hypothetical protein [Escherichia coli]